jgi:hypothetical protein
MPIRKQKESRLLLSQSSRTCERAVLCLHFHRLRPLVLLIRVTLRKERSRRGVSIIVTQDSGSKAHRVISSFRRKVDENCALLGCYATILDP